MHSPSRRAFLRGRQLAGTSWGQFCQRVQGTVDGKLVTFTVPDGLGLGSLTIEHAADVPRVLSLCREHGVVLALDGLSMPARAVGRPTLRLRPGRSLARFKRLEDHGNLWFVQPGCTLGELAKAGLSAFSALPASTTAAAWLADRTLVDFMPGQTARSGLAHLQLLLPDGDMLTLGPFGHDDARPLDTDRSRQLVSSLFRLTAGGSARGWLPAAFWPLRYRLDALMAHEQAPINLAHLLLGHGGDLGWVQWMVIDADTLDASAGMKSRYSTDLVDIEGWADAANPLDDEIKFLFDPEDLLSHRGQDI